MLHERKRETGRGIEKVPARHVITHQLGQENLNIKRMHTYNRTYILPDIKALVAAAFMPNSFGGTINITTRPYHQQSVRWPAR